MSSETQEAAPSKEWQPTKGNGSIAHNIIGEFLVDLTKKEDYGEIAKNLEEVLFSGKPTELALRIAMFGDDIL